jgi:hypothetical protein
MRITSSVRGISTGDRSDRVGASGLFFFLLLFLEEEEDLVLPEVAAITPLRTLL